ncbi:hypothetical protein M9458_048190, partial [Cirrhinus mrigala]
CSLFVSQQPHLYPTEESKVAFVALDWATAVWRLDRPTFPFFAAFMQRFKGVFQPSTENGEAGEQIMALRQGRRTAADYALWRLRAAGRMSRSNSITARAYIRIYKW